MLEISDYNECMDNLINNIDRDMMSERLRMILKTLTEKEKLVLELRFGLKDGKQHTLKDIGQMFELYGFNPVQQERIRQIEAKALRKLRHPTKVHLLNCPISMIKQKLEQEENDLLLEEESKRKILEGLKEQEKIIQGKIKKEEKKLKTKLKEGHIMDIFIEDGKNKFMKNLAPIEKDYDYYMGVIIEDRRSNEELQKCCKEINDKSDKNLRMIKICKIDNKKLLIFEFKSEFVKPVVCGVVASICKYLKVEKYHLEYINSLHSIIFDAWGSQQYYKITDGNKEYELKILK